MPEVLTKVDPDDSVEKLSGRELDAAVAERVMGWPVYEQPNNPEGNDAWYASRSYPCLITHSEGGYWLATGWAQIRDWYPSTSIQAAMEVVEKIGFEANDSMRAINISVLSIHRYPDGQWLVHFSLKGKAYADTLPRAICLAALKAVGAE